MREGRWTIVTETDFDHERRGLEAIREKLPDTGVWRAWSNFTFTANTGHVREVDLLVLAPNGLHMIELKNWRGTLTSRNGTWVQTFPGSKGRGRTHANARHLVEQKARELAGLLSGQRARTYISSAVCFTDSSLRIQLPGNDQNGVYLLDQLVERLRAAPSDERHRIVGPQAKRTVSGLEAVGINPSHARYKVGPYDLDRAPLETGPTWSDYLGRHSDVTETARVRIYLSERGASSEERRSVEDAARRETDVLRHLTHPGVVRYKQYLPAGHSAGPALIFDYRPDTLRLDEYLIQYGDQIDIADRMALVRQLAETLRWAHSNRVHHRSLSAGSIHVLPGRDGRASGAQASEADAAWLTPLLQVSDWQLAQRHSNGARATPASGSSRHYAHSALSLGHVSDAADAYLAPDLTAANPDPVLLDVYGLGVLTYLLATGRPPAASQADLVAQLKAGEGLTPSAVVDGLSVDIDDLVQAATAYRPGQRLSTVDEFLEMLEVVEDTLTTPSSGHEALIEHAPQTDPLEAVAGDVLAGRWEVRRRLGTGSTSRAFLVRDLTVPDPPPRGTRPMAVLKVALSDSCSAALIREGQVLGGLDVHQGIIRMVEREPLTIGGRTVLALDYVGDERGFEESSSGDQGGKPRRREETVARELRENGRLPVDRLEAYGDYLFGAVQFLESEGVWHRDIKPDNIAIRIRPNRTRELVLIDFSLAGIPVQEIRAGTQGYLDPFLGVEPRGIYDAHAERYAIAATLHEMASGELPAWGEGRETPDQSDAAEPTLAAEAFDSAVRKQLDAFFRKALHRDVDKRFPDLKPMRDEWRRIFLEMSRTVTSSGGEAVVPAQGESATGEARFGVVDTRSAEEQRELQAQRATRETPLAVAGLSPAAVSALHQLELHTVGGLLDHSQRKFLNAPGMGAKTRREIQQRQRQWTERLNDAPQLELAHQARRDAREEVGDYHKSLESGLAGQLAQSEGSAALPPDSVSRLSLDALAAIALPELHKNGSNHSEVETIRLLLRLPDDNGTLPGIGAWPMQKDVALALGVSQGRIPQILKRQRTRWRKDPAIQAVRTEVLEQLRRLGRVASAVEIADFLVLRRGTGLPEFEQRQALGLAMVRAVVETEQLEPQEAEFQHTANRRAEHGGASAGLLAREVGQQDDPDTPSAPGLLDYAQRLGRTADRLANLETLPTSTTVLNELGALSRPAGRIDWDERRMVEVAAAASSKSAVTPRLEIYPRDLSLVRALRLTQAGLVREYYGFDRGKQPGLLPETVHERVLARFPEITDPLRGRKLPLGGPLTKALRDAGFDLELLHHADNGKLRYLPPEGSDQKTSYTSVGSSSGRYGTRSLAPTRYDDDPDQASAAAADERLAVSWTRDGFRVLTVRWGRSTRALELLADWGNRGSRDARDAEVVSVTELFLSQMRQRVQPGQKPTWEAVLRADVAALGTAAANGFAQYARTSWNHIEPELRAKIERQNGAGQQGPLLLTDATAFARYGAMDTLERLADTARQGGRGLWLLCPQEDPARKPWLGRTAVPYQEGFGEWIVLSDSWVRSGLEAQHSDEERGGTA